LPRHRGGLITQSPLPLRIGADNQPTGPDGNIRRTDQQTPPEPVRMMVEGGTLVPVPSDDELHPASVPLAGAPATLSSPDDLEPDQAEPSSPVLTGDSDSSVPAAAVSKTPGAM
jgi:hypothetical protein